MQKEPPNEGAGKVTGCVRILDASWGQVVQTRAIVAMRVIVKINTSAKTVYSKFTGAITDSDMRSAVADLAKHPGFDPAFSHIIDFSGVTSASVSPNFIRALAHEKPL